MSNEVYGFAEFVDPISSAEEIADELQQSTGLGIVLIRPDELYNFTVDYQPTANSLVFMVTDRPESKNATYLIDFEDYVSEAKIGLPTNGVQRLDLLLTTIESLFTSHHANRVCIAITDSSQIEECKVVSRTSLREVLLCDFEVLAPPCCLYDINEVEPPGATG